MVLGVAGLLLRLLVVGLVLLVPGRLLWRVRVLLWRVGGLLLRRGLVVGGGLEELERARQSARQWRVSAVVPRGTEAPTLLQE